MKDLTKIQFDSLIKKSISIRIRLKTIFSFVKKITKKK